MRIKLGVGIDKKFEHDMVRRFFFVIFSFCLCISRSISAEECYYSEDYESEQPCDPVVYEFEGFCSPAWIWIPDAPLFRPFVADPRALSFSIGWRFGDSVFNKNTAPVSFDNHFGVFRLDNPYGTYGTLQLEIEAGVWAVFEHTDRLMPLDNADYAVAVPLVYCTGPWKFRLRAWHMSSHLGDEFMAQHPEITRRNPSAEYLDFFVSYEPTWQLRIYGGIGYVLRSDKVFPCKHFYAEYGIETRLAEWNNCYLGSQLWGRPFVAAHFRTREDNDFRFDGTFVAGYEWARLSGIHRSVRIFGEYHTGFSFE